MANTKRSNIWRQAWALNALIKRPADRLPRGFKRIKVTIEGPAERTLGGRPIMIDEAHRAPAFSAETIRQVAKTSVRN